MLVCFASRILQNGESIQSAVKRQCLRRRSRSGTDSGRSVSAGAGRGIPAAGRGGAKE